MRNVLTSLIVGNWFIVLLVAIVKGEMISKEEKETRRRSWIRGHLHLWRSPVPDPSPIIYAGQSRAGCTGPNVLLQLSTF